MVKAVEIKGKSPVDLQKQIADAKEELFNLRFQQATGQLENTARLKNLRHDIARLKNEIHSQEIAELAKDKTKKNKETDK